ncbi:hypothetical protein CSV86_000015 [Pseudomonas putida CSV86]|uniref:Uncharacterized protein n=1 Tax=Pseudomonas bharatica CSV86 TaxID=1005395 RepID=A0A7K4E7P4_9PSED|nr:hypothetical protein [Pseudomonas bharatica]NNJ13774.1 hypothetical protein [Pseudomonas bharatica CSV86]
MSLQTGLAGQVNLLVNSPNLIMQFWDGVDTTNNGLIEAGSGVWDATTSNWALSDGFQQRYLAESVRGVHGRHRHRHR